MASGAGSASFAASATWTGATDSLWSTPTNWTASPVPGTGDTATFNNAGNGNTTLSLGVGGVTIKTITFDTASAAAYTLGGGAVGNEAIEDPLVIHRRQKFRRDFDGLARRGAFVTSSCAQTPL